MESSAARKASGPGDSPGSSEDLIDNDIAIRAVFT
jgi:hypothetical protein